MAALIVRRAFESVKTFEKKRWAMLGMALLVAATTTAVCWPEIRYRSALPKYRFGITAEALERESGIRIELRKNGNYLPDGMDDLNKRRHCCYDARVPRGFVEIDFN